MSDKTKKIFKYLSGFILAGIFLYLSLKGKDFSAILHGIKNSNKLYLIFSVFFYLFSFVGRAEKWRIQIENLKFKVNPKHTYFALTMHYFFNAFTPKLGIFARCRELKSRTQISISSCLASYFSEVALDTISLLAALIFILLVEFQKIKIIFSNFINDLSGKIHIKNLYYLLFILFILVFFLALKNKKLRQKNSGIQTFLSSIKKTFKLKKIGLFIIWNFVVWICLLLFNYFMFKSITTSVECNFNIILTITVFTYFGWLMPTPGGIGSVEYFILQAFLLFGLDSHLAVSFGIISNGITFLSILSIGIIFLILDKTKKIFQ